MVETTELERHLTNDAVVPQALFDDVPSHRKSPSGLSFTVIRKYLQQLIINADKQGAYR